MSSTEAAPRLPGKMPLWKRLVLIGVSVGAGLGIMGTIVGLSIHWYYSHPRMTHEWPEHKMQAYGLKASLKTRWRDDALHYQLQISPLSPDAVDAFDKAFTTLTEPLDFTLYLYDDSGFQTCSDSIDASDIKHDVNREGKIKGLSVNTTWGFCSYEHYRDSRKWNLAWKGLPKVSTDTAAITPIAPTASAQQAPRTEKLEKTEGSETLTGVDPVNSRLDTESGHVFWVYSTGEQYTILAWSAKEQLRFTCRTRSDCVVVNTDRKETVHARLIK